MLGLFGVSEPSLTSGHRSRTLSFFSGGPLLLDRRPGGSVPLARSVRYALACTRFSTNPRPLRRVILGRSSFSGAGLWKAGDGFEVGGRRV